MLEKRFNAVPPQPFTANGTANGVVTVADTRLFKVKQRVFLRSNTVPSTDGLEVKRIISQTQLVVGPEKQPIHVHSDVSNFLVADNAVIGSNEQVRPSIPVEEFSRAVYEEEPTVAVRTMLVDKQGNDYRVDNPLPVQLSTGSVNIDTVNADLNVQLTHLDNYPNVGDENDSVRLGDGVSTMTGSLVSPGRYALDVLPANAIVKRRYDSIVVTARNLDGDPTQIEFRLGTTVMQTMSITYNSDGDVDSVVVV